MTARRPPRPVSGFTLAELLVALATLGILLAMLVQVTGQVASNTQALGDRLENTSEAARLRRLLHRDFTAAEPYSFKITGGGFRVITSHNLLTGQPLPVEAEWDFSGGAIRRIERLIGQGYAKELLLSADLSGWKAEVFVRDTRIWTDMRNLFAGSGDRHASGLRLTLVLPGGTMEMVEPFPEAR